jgi:hypothetical protein
MTVWDVAHPKLESGDAFERKLCRQLAEAARKQLAALEPKDGSSLSKWREVVGGAFEAIAGRALPAKEALEFAKSDETDAGSYIRFTGLLKDKSRGEELPMAFLHPKQWNGRAVVILSERGKSGLFAEDGSPAVDANRLLDAGNSIVGVDLLLQGEFLPEGEPAAKNRSVKNTREFAGYTYGYNYSLLAQRAHDVLTVVSFVKHHADGPKSVELVALDGTAPVAAAALALSGGAVRRAALDTRGFRFGKLTDYLDANFLPGGAKYGDLPGLLSLAAPTKLWLAGETAESAAIVKKVYEAGSAAGAVVFDASQGEEARRGAFEWMIKAN